MAINQDVLRAKMIFASKSDTNTSPSGANITVSNSSTGDAMITFKTDGGQASLGLDSTSDRFAIQWGTTGLATTGIELDSSNRIGVGAAPDASAKLALTSTSTGFLPPRMTSAQMEAISSPTIGLMVYNSTSGAWWGFSSGSTWVKLNNSA